MNAVAPRSAPGLAALACACVLAVLGPSGDARASDEDMTTSAYLVFDPETGQFVTVHDPDRSRQHAEEQEPAQGGDGQAAAGDSKAGGTGAEGGQSVPAVAAAGVGVVLAVAAAFVWFRRKQPKNT